MMAGLRPPHPAERYFLSASDRWSFPVLSGNCRSSTHSGDLAEDRHARTSPSTDHWLDSRGTLLVGLRRCLISVSTRKRSETTCSSLARSLYGDTRAAKTVSLRKCSGKLSLRNISPSLSQF